MGSASDPELNGSQDGDIQRKGLKPGRESRRGPWQRWCCFCVWTSVGAGGYIPSAFSWIDLDHDTFEKRLAELPVETSDLHDLHGACAMWNTHCQAGSSDRRTRSGLWASHMDQRTTLAAPYPWTLEAHGDVGHRATGCECPCCWSGGQQKIARS